MNGMGIAIMSTPKGIMTDRQARVENVGGEVLALAWLGGAQECLDLVENL